MYIFFFIFFFYFFLSQFYLVLVSYFIHQTPLSRMTRAGKRRATASPSSTESEDIDFRPNYNEVEEEHTHDTTRFVSMTNEAWYERRLDAKLLVEKNITPEVDEKFQIFDLFRTLNWENAFNFPEYYYEEIVQEFYANVDEKDKNIDLIWTTVRGKEFVITAKNINEWLGIPDEGQKIQFKKTFDAPEGPVWKMSEALARFGVQYTPSQSNSKLIVSTMSFSARFRLAIYIMGTNIVPRSSGTNEVRISDLYFLDKMVNGLGTITGINYGSIIINHMRDFFRSKSAKHAIPYARLVSLIVEKNNVDLSGVTRIGIKKSNRIGRHTCIKMNIEFDDNGNDETTPHSPVENAQPLAIELPPSTSTESPTRITSARRRRSSSLLRKIWDKLTCMQNEVNTTIKDVNTRLEQIERHLGIAPPPPPPPSSQTGPST